MVDRLLKEKADEVKHRDFCIEQLNTNERETTEATQSKQDTEAKIAELQATLDALTKEIEGLKTEMATESEQLKRAGEDREKANKDFQVTVADQRATQKLLSTALGILKGFYEKAALLQARAQAAVKAGQAQPAFKKFEKNKASGGVMGMMQGIIDDAKALEAEALRDEGDSQKEYEEFVQDTNVSTESADIHRSCDFVLKNFEVRGAARDAEIEALKQAIALFSGAKMAALLQHW